MLGGDTVEHVDVRDRGGTEVLGGDTVELKCWGATRWSMLMYVTARSRVS